MQHKVTAKRIFIIVVCILSFSLCGCWDYFEMEKRGYVLGIGIDKANNEPTDKFKYMPLEAKGQLYAFTIQIPIISRAQNKPTGQSGAGGSPERQWNLTIVSNTFFEATREYSTILDFPPFFPHLQSIVISKSAAETDMSKLFDMFLRDPEMRRKTKIFITPDRASDVLDVIPRIDDYSAKYLRSLPDNYTKTSRLLHRTDLGKISEAMHENRDYVLPKVVGNRNDIKDAGCAVFKDNKMVGWLDELKTSYLNWVTNNARGGLVTVNPPQWNNSPVVLEIKKVKTKQKPIVRNNAIEMLIDVKANLSLGEVSHTSFPNVLSSNFLHQLEKLAEEKIKTQIEDTIAFVQNEYDADIFLFDVTLQRFAPETWEKVKDNWDEKFRTLKVTVNVKVKINQIGLIK